MMKEKIEPMVYLPQYDVIFHAIEGDLHVIGKPPQVTLYAYTLDVNPNFCNKTTIANVKMCVQY